MVDFARVFTPLPRFSLGGGVERPNLSMTSSRQLSWRRLVVTAYVGMAIAVGLDAAEPANLPDTVAALKRLPLEALFQQEVTLVSRRPEPLFASPSAIQVITAEDINRSGALNLAEALRLAPNLQVAQQNAHDWAISARGFNGAPLGNSSLADKLLVMIDGRSVYSPLFGGVFWDVQNVLLANIDRIEVVSGPGGTLWGANAVNGVINVVTKSARETQGLYVAGAGGSFWQDFGAVQYGAGNGSNLFYRVYGQRFDHNSTVHPDGTEANDAWDMSQGGFRMDYLPSTAHTFTLQGDFYSGSEGDPRTTRIDGQNILGRWTRTFSSDSDLKVQAYWDRTWRHLSDVQFADDLNTLDLDVQQRFAAGERNTIVWGGDYRLMIDSVRNSPAISFFPRHRNLQLGSAFVQDEIALRPDSLTLTLGTKLEHNDFSGFELQPSARIAWLPTSKQTVWAAVSRAVRAPARFDADEVSPSIVTPGHDFASEKVLAYELGYRLRPIKSLSLSLAGFFNQYDELRSLNLNETPPPVLVFSNDQKAETWGIELSGEVQVVEGWRMRAGYTYLHEHIRATDAAVLPGSVTIEANDPQHQFLVQSMLDLPGHFRFDTVARYVDALPGTAVPSPRIPAYLTVDARLAWEFKGVELSLVGQNLADNQHPEFSSLEIPRSVYGKITWRF